MISIITLGVREFGGGEEVSSMSESFGLTLMLQADLFSKPTPSKSCIPMAESAG